MAAFPTARAHAHLPGQGSGEFILIMPVLLTFLFAIGSFAMLSYQNTVIQHSLATLADALPAGWQEQDRNELVRDLVCDGTDLDKSRLTVTNARVKADTSGAVNDGDSIASDLGASTLRTETRRVAVEARELAPQPDGATVGGGERRGRPHADERVARQDACLSGLEQEGALPRVAQRLVDGDGCEVVGQQAGVHADDAAGAGQLRELGQGGFDDHATSPAVSSVKKQVWLPVWQAAPVCSTVRRIVSPSQSAATETTRWWWPDVSPLTQYSFRERDQ